MENLFLFCIGSTKLVAIRVKSSDSLFFDVVKVNEVEPTGFEYGNIVDPELALQDIRRLKSGIGTQKEFLKFPSYIILESALTSTYALSTSLYFNRLKKIRFSDVEKVIRQTRDCATLPLKDQITFTIPQSFMVNDLSGIRNPVGLEGTRLAVDIIMETVDMDNWSQLHHTFGKLGIQIKSILSRGLCGSLGLLSEEEKKESTLFLDIGGRLTSLVFMQGSRIRRSSMLNFGGESWTDRIKERLNISEKEAVRIKEQFGSIQSDAHTSFHDEIIPSSQNFGTVRLQELTFKDLQPILKEAIDDFLELIKIETDRIESLEGEIKQIVVSGGGAKLEGFLEYTSQELQRPVRMVHPSRIKTKLDAILQPQYASYLGALHFLSDQRIRENEFKEGDNLISKFFRFFKTLIRDYF